jgi:RNA recognition motif-containing protein
LPTRHSARRFSIPCSWQTGKIEHVNILRDGMGKSRGVGFVRFSNGQDAATAVRTMNGVTPPGERKTLQVRVAKQSGAARTGLANKVEDTPVGYGPMRTAHGSARFDPMAGPSLPPAAASSAPSGLTPEQKCNIYVAGLPKAYSKVDVDALFGACGTISNSNVLYDPKTKESRGIHIACCGSMCG